MWKDSDWPTRSRPSGGRFGDLAKHGSRCPPGGRQPAGPCRSRRAGRLVRRPLEPTGAGKPAWAVPERFIAASPRTRATHARLPISGGPRALELRLIEDTRHEKMTAEQVLDVARSLESFPTGA